MNNIIDFDDDNNSHICVAIKKNKPNLNDPEFNYKSRCKSTKKQNSIFCYIHKKHKPDSVIVGLQTTITTDNTNNTNTNIKEWITIPFTNEKDIIIEIQTKKDEIKKEVLEKINKEKEAINAITTCKVCFEKVANNHELIRCSKVTSDNQHLVCNTCIGGHIDSLIVDGCASYNCMFNKSDKCCGEYTTQNIIDAINNPNPNPSKQELWDELINISEITKMASICDDYFICPLCCKWGCIYETPAGYQGIVNIPCGKCGQQWCNSCKRKSHDNRSCFNIEFNEDENTVKRIEIIDHMIQELVTKSLMHCCSTCGSSYIKEEGCNLMVCPKCESMTCYLCSMKLYYKNNTKYWHFIGHELSDPDAQCNLWNNVAGDGKEKQGNTEFNEKSIIKELSNFILCNDKEIGNLIYERIIHLYEKDNEYKNVINVITDINNTLNS